MLEQVSTLIVNEELISSTDAARYIQAQARVAFGKCNRNSGITMEDLISIGNLELVKARESFDSTKNAKFSSYLTIRLQSRFYKVMRDTHAKKRGGAGCKQDDVRLGRGERWENEEEIQTAQHVSIDETVGDDMQFQLPAPADHSAEFDLLIEQMMKLLPKCSRRVFKQMVDPDLELTAIAHRNAQGKKSVNLTNQMVADYLGISLAEFKEHREVIEKIIGKALGRK